MEDIFMTIREEVTARMKDAMRAKDTATTSTLRLIIARLKDVEIQLRPSNKEVTSDDEIMALRSMVKSRKDSILLYSQGGRQELADKEQAEIDVIEQFLPPQMSDEDISEAVKKAIAETGATSAKQMGQVMGNLKKTFGANLDMSRISPLVKSLLA
jgi:uncharacterized protein YqeY